MGEGTGCFLTGQCTSQIKIFAEYQVFILCKNSSKLNFKLKLSATPIRLPKNSCASSHEKMHTLRVPTHSQCCLKIWINICEQFLHLHDIYIYILNSITHYSQEKNLSTQTNPVIAEEDEWSLTRASLFNFTDLMCSNEKVSSPPLPQFPSHLVK